MKNVSKRTNKTTNSGSSRAAPRGRPLTARAVAELCGVELKTVHNWAADGRLAHFRTPGRHLRFQPEVVETFLTECGYETNAKRRKRAVCLAPRPNARLRKVLADVDCTWVRDVWAALLEIGRAAPDIWVVDASGVIPEGLLRAVKTVRRRVPATEVAVFRERPSDGDEPSLTCVGFDGLARLVSR